jgi:hypothetical protein
MKKIRSYEKLDYQKLGPSLIVKQINVMAFQFKFPSSMRIHLVFHFSLLEPYHASTLPGRIHDPLPPIEVNDEHEYEVEDNLDSRMSNCQF